jgi:hypothetical protein
MGAAEKIPWQELPLNAKDCAELWEVSADHFLATIACLPDFPERLTYKPATWRAGEVIEYRNTNRVGRQDRRRRSGSK